MWHVLSCAQVEGRAQEVELVRAKILVLTISAGALGASTGSSAGNSFRSLAVTVACTEQELKLVVDGQIGWQFSRA